MNFVSKLAGFTKTLDRRFWPDHRVVISPEVAGLLRENRLIVADVGSAGGPEEMWHSLSEFIHFLAFEPNPRPGEESGGLQMTNFPIGLWSKEGEMKLHMAGNPDSSSLLPINTKLFADFLTKGGMEMIGETTIRVDTLDHLLTGKPELSPDYMKVDVEGGDLEVLKGAKLALAGSILGSRIETSFLDLHIGAPLIWEVDTFMRQQGFVLFNLGRNYWVRNNGLHGFTSRPQLAWSDVTYFLSRESFLQRLTAARDVSHRKLLLAKFVVVLLRFGVHDYTWDVIEDARTAGLVPAEFCDSLKASVKKSMDTSIWYFAKACFGVAFSCAVFLISFPFKEPRTRSIYYIKQRLGRLGFDLWRRTSLEGRVRHACVGDSLI